MSSTPLSPFLTEYDAAMQLRQRGETAAAWEAMRSLAAVSSAGLSPDEPLVETTLAAWCKKDGNLDEAIVHAERYCTLLPSDPFGFSILSSYCIAAGRRDEAEAALMAAQRARLAAHHFPPTAASPVPPTHVPPPHGQPNSHGTTDDQPNPDCG